MGFALESGEKSRKKTDPEHLHEEFNLQLLAILQMNDDF